MGSHGITWAQAQLAFIADGVHDLRAGKAALASQACLAYMAIIFLVIDEEWAHPDPLFFVAQLFLPV